MDEIFIAYLRVKNFLLVSRAICLVLNNKLFIEQVRYAPVASLKAVWRIDSIILFM